MIEPDESSLIDGGQRYEIEFRIKPHIGWSVYARISDLDDAVDTARDLLRYHGAETVRIIDRQPEAKRP